jgi:chromosome partitioning protein
MRTLAIVNQKGGTGKTTTAVNLAASLTFLGKKVLLMDLDPQASASFWYGFKKQGQPLVDLFLEDKDLLSVVQKTKVENLDIVPASQVLVKVEKHLATELGAETILKNKFDMIENKPWDYLIIDCPPNLGALSLNALTAVNEVVIPVEGHAMALHGLVQLLNTIKLVQKRLNPALKITGILPCRIDFRTNHSKAVLDQLKFRFNDQLCQTVIRENIKLAEASLYLKPIHVYDPKSRGANDYHELAKELLEREENYKNVV